MRAHIASGLLTGGLSALLLGTAAQAQEGIPEPAALQSRIDQMQRQLEEQRMLINALARELAVQRDAMARRGVRADERQRGKTRCLGKHSSTSAARHPQHNSGCIVAPGRWKMASARGLARQNVLQTP
jgi:septal ring factor EnvC (AmiA/AmiB activator)